MRYKYVSINRVFSKLLRDLGAEVAESDVIEWTGEALEFIGAVKSYEEAIAFIEVKNHQCDLPNNIHAIVQIARNQKWTAPDDKFCPKEVSCAITEDNDDCTSDKAPDFIILDCNGQPLNDYDVAYYRPYFDLKSEYYGWSNSSYYKQNYTPVRLATSTFFNTLVCSTDENPSVYQATKDEYTIVAGTKLRFSFKEGSVAVSYLRQMTDPETGYPMIPDHISYTTAIVKYITLKVAERHFYAGREGAAGRVQKAEADWHWYCKQAGNVDMMPHGIDEHQNMLDQRSYLLPRTNNYYGFFGRLAAPENRTWNDPDGRNHKDRFFIGN